MIKLVSLGYAGVSSPWSLCVCLAIQMNFLHLLQRPFDWSPGPNGSWLLGILAFNYLSPSPSLSLFIIATSCHDAQLDSSLSYKFVNLFTTAWPFSCSIGINCWTLAFIYALSLLLLPMLLLLLSVCAPVCVRMRPLQVFYCLYL